MTNTILQVEDDLNDVFLFRHAMQKVGVTTPIQVVTDGQQAIDYLSGAGKFADRETFPLPCLVLLDLKLPHIMGLDVLKWCREQPGVAKIVVMLSASGEEADIAEAYRLGANAYLVKPSEASKLQDMARAIRDFWLMQNTPPPDARVEEEAEYVRSPHPTRVAVGRRDRAERRPLAVNGAFRDPSPIRTREGL